jgi:integrase
LEILDLAFHTGRRLSAILNLRHSDYNPQVEDEQGRKLLYGAVTWRGEFDKQGKEWVSALNQQAQAAIQRIRRDRPGMGDALMFPSRDDPMKPLNRHVADTWLRKAEALAELESQQWTLWHGYRRGWATARQHLPATMTAHTGGWRSPATMQKCYQQTGLAEQLQVVTDPAEVWEREA